MAGMDEKRRPPLFNEHFTRLDVALILAIIVAVAATLALLAYVSRFSDP